MIDPEYMPEPGEFIVHETFVTDVFGGAHLSGVRVLIRARLSHAAAHAARRRYPGAQLRGLLDEHGEAAEIEIPLRLTDDDLWPYLAWRDKLLARVYGALSEKVDHGKETH